MLSASASASGANLQIANHLVLLDPPGHNPAHGAALEQQVHFFISNICCWYIDVLIILLLLSMISAVTIPEVRMFLSFFCYYQ